MLYNKCKKHINPHNAQEVQGAIMTEEARKARNAYKREWAKKNPDKVMAQQERYWTKRANIANTKAAWAAKGKPANNPELTAAE